MLTRVIFLNDPKSTPARGTDEQAPVPRIAALTVVAPKAPPPAKCDLWAKPDEKSYTKDLALGHFGDKARLFGLIYFSDFIKLIAGDEIGSDFIPKLEEITKTKKEFSHAWSSNWGGIAAAMVTLEARPNRQTTQ
jgi:hypothetical protein